MALELLNELGDPDVKLWRLLSGRNGDLEAARVVSKLAGAILEHGESLVDDTLQAILDSQPSPASSEPGPPTEVTIPAALQRYTIEATLAANCDALLQAQR